MLWNRKNLISASAIFAAVFTVVWTLGVSETFAQSSKSTVILDTSGFWRYHYTLKAPVVRIGSEIKPLDVFVDTPFPSEKWREHDFDDFGWLRLPGGSFPPVYPSWGGGPKDRDAGFIYNDSSSTCLALICARGEFHVSDPAKVRGLRLSLAYRGGVIVYVNGKEIARHNMPEGKATLDTLAKDYPMETFVNANGTLLNARNRKPDAETFRRWGLRTRKLENVEISGNALRKGVNILAIEVHRSPYYDKLPELLRTTKNRNGASLWCTCDLMKVRLVAPGGSAVTPNVVRPEGIQVWNADVLISVFDLDFGDPNEPLRPVRIISTLNGTFSGKVVIGSTNSIRELSVTMSDLKSTKGGRNIPATAVRIRYPAPYGTESGSTGRYPALVNRFDALLEKVPAEIPVRVKKAGRGTRAVVPGEPSHVSGAVQPIWLTVKIPVDVVTGEYKGTLIINMKGAKPVKIPVELKVCGFRLPEPHKYRTWAGFIQSPETLSLKYKVPLWSEEHWKLVEKSIQILGDVGDKTVYIPLICGTNQGNEQSMVRWIKTGNGKYKYDFTLIEKYLDIVQKYQKHPEVVCLYVWDLFLRAEDARWTAHKSPKGRPAAEARYKYRIKGPEVTILDPATGKTENIFLPLFADAKALELWKPMMDELRERIKKRGWEKSMMIGMASDGPPMKADVEFFNKLLPGLPWIQHCHTPRNNVSGTPVGYGAGVWSPRFAIAPENPLLYGWKRADVRVQFRRGSWNGGYSSIFRLIGEINIMGAQRGFGRVGADFWNVISDKKGRRRHGLGERYWKAEWTNLNILTSVLAPGPDGPVSTTRLEMMREGIQECEARILVERAVTDKALRAKLGGKLAKRCEKILAERTIAIQIAHNDFNERGFRKRPRKINATRTSLATYHWYLVSGWQERSGKLFTVAAEVARKIGRK